MFVFNFCSLKSALKAVCDGSKSWGIASLDFLCTAKLLEIGPSCMNDHHPSGSSSSPLHLCSVMLACSAEEECHNWEYQCGKCPPLQQVSCCDQCHQVKQQALAGTLDIANKAVDNVECYEKTSCSNETLQKIVVEHQDRGVDNGCISSPGF